MDCDDVTDADGVHDAVAEAVSLTEAVTDGDGVDVLEFVCVGDGGTSTTGMDWILSPVSTYEPTELPRPFRYVTVAPSVTAPISEPLDTGVVNG